MKQALLLRQYKLTIPVSSLVLSAMQKNTNKNLSERLPLLQVDIDFEKSKLKLEGEWSYLVAPDESGDTDCFNYHTNRVFIDVTIHPGLPPDLNDQETDGLILTLKGIIDDGKSFGSCMGVITLDRNRDTPGPQWTISCYISDLRYPDCEIKCKLPVYDVFY